ncbi:tetratricopeptide repeat protein (plasmid) [Alicyclobacillus fastidiosus]|uniref:Tetratricopeptide repeat protein n=1 Tax=Alicyclobacillus fastidiosus TaxID=392011 RepID=A0ABY6ZPF5_9BACL|nr:tetratricopeptide repeat protein [Alicyclobacillus fastidiosus]WAH44863.1 tetratricopeptide repeat protein [Alicyclobacillus fastidiosus]GMA65618.1 hypothetical protein GCM10025859_60580 [Alicyclobacillus fastidiosus]GMA65835.1 hypothetical protein GCM10025859_62750 [Alicyclobacillus fastidiosus]
MLSRVSTVTSAAILIVSVLSGCGAAYNSNNTTSASSQVTADNSTHGNTTAASAKVTADNSTSKFSIGPEKEYQSPTAYKTSLEKAAKEPSNAAAQIKAAQSCYMNAEYSEAIKYYEKAIAIDPQNGVPYNNIGNIYLRVKNQPKAALPYYQKATQVQPTYSYGWLNLAIAQEKLGQKNIALQSLLKGLSVTKNSDPVYKMLQNEQDSIQKSTHPN